MKQRTLIFSSSVRNVGVKRKLIYEWNETSCDQRPRSAFCPSGSQTYSPTSTSTGGIGACAFDMMSVTCSSGLEGSYGVFMSTNRRSSKSISDGFRGAQG